MTETTSTETMSTETTAPATTTATAAPTTAVLDVAATPPTPFGRLVKVEWRKMVDTRSGFWLTAITALLLLLVMVIVILVVALADDATTTAGDMVSIFTIPVSLLLPVFAILIVTSEWSQRTALTTFTLEANRMRVVGAKFVAVSTLAVGTMVVATAMGALTNVVSAAVAGVGADWTVDLSALAWTVVVQLLFFWMAFAFGLVLLNTPGAITLFYIVGMILPLLVWSSLFAVFGWAQNVLPWIDLTIASLPIMDGTNILGEEVDVGATEYLQFAWTTFLWVAIPALAGTRRIRHAEVK